MKVGQISGNPIKMKELSVTNSNQTQMKQGLLCWCSATIDRTRATPQLLVFY
jgi:hypothetical protein